MAIMNMFSGGSGARVPLEAPTDLVIVSRDSSSLISWTDPVDKIATPGGEAVSTWAYTVLVRKEGSAPTSAYDGVQVLKETTRNQYESVTYTDSGLVNGTTYYYAVYAYNTIGMASEALVGSVTPTAAMPEYAGTFESQYSDHNELAAMSSTENYFILAGGVTSNYYNTPFSKTVSAFTYDLTESVLPNNLSGNNGSGIGNMNPFSFNGHAVFLSGTYGSVGSGEHGQAGFHTVSDSLTLTFNETYSLNQGKCIGVTTTENYAVFAGAYNPSTTYTSRISAIDKSFSSRSISASLSKRTCYKSSATAGSTAVFYGGIEYGDWVKVQEVVSVNDSLTMQKLADAPSDACNNVAGASFSGKAVFVGGHGYGQGGSDGTAYVYYYDSSLTKHVGEPLTQTRYDAVGIPFNNYLAIIGGRGFGDPSSSSSPIYYTELYDASFTKCGNPDPDIDMHQVYGYWSAGAISYGRVNNKVLINPYPEVGRCVFVYQ